MPTNFGGSVVTTDATPTPINLFLLETGKLYQIDLRLLARADDGTCWSLRVLRSGKFIGAGPPVLIGTPPAPLINNKEVAAAAWAANPGIDANNLLLVEVTGAAGLVIHWQISGMFDAV